MNKKMKMVPWATDENKKRFVIFMADRGKDKANAFVWIDTEAEERGVQPVRITTFRGVIEYFTQAARPLYFGEDRPKELMDAAVSILNEVPDNALGGLLDEFYDEAYRREEQEKERPWPIRFEKESLEFLEKAGKEGDGISAI